MKRGIMDAVPVFSSILSMMKIATMDVNATVIWGQGGYYWSENIPIDRIDI